MSDDFIYQIAASVPGSTWFHPSDRATWFEDAALTIPTDDPARVRFIKNKVGVGAREVNGLTLEGRLYGYDVPEQPR